MSSHLCSFLFVCFSFSSLRFVKVSDLLSAGLPFIPSEFEAFVGRQCQSTRDDLIHKWVRQKSLIVLMHLMIMVTFRWIPECASILDIYKDLWLQRIPQTSEAPVYVLEFFSWVSSLMSLQLRTLVMDSLNDVFNFICKYKVWINSLAPPLVLNMEAVLRRWEDGL